MAGDNENVNVQFGATIDGLVSGVDQVKEQIQSIDGVVSGLKETFLGVGEALATLFAVEKIDQFMEHVTDLGVQVERTAQQLGITTTAVGGLNAAAEFSDTSLANMRNGMARFDLNIQSAAKGTGNAAAAFETLGISIRNNDGTIKDSSVLMQQVADRFSQTADNGNKTAVAMALFGRTGKDLIPILDLGSEGLDKLNAKFGDMFPQEVVDRLHETHDKIVELNLEEERLSLTTSGVLAPAYDVFKQAEIDAVSYTNDLVIKVGELINEYKDLDTGLMSVTDTVNVIGAAFYTMGVNAAASVLAANIKIETYWNELKAFFSGNVSEIGVIEQEGAKKVEGVWKEAADNIQKYWDDVASHLQTDLSRAVAAGGMPGAGSLGGDPNEQAVVPKPGLKPMGDNMGGGSSKDEMAADLEAYKEELAQKLQAQQVYGVEAQNLEVQFWKDALQDQEVGSKEYVAIEKEMNDAYKGGLQDQVNAVGTTNAQKVQLYSQYFAWLRQNYATDFKDQNEAYIKIEKLNRQTVQHNTQQWYTFFKSFNSGLIGMLEGTETWQRSMQNMFNRVLNFFLEMVEKKVAKWAAAELLQNNYTQVGNSIREALGLQAEATDKATTTAMATGQITADAGVAYAGTFAFLAPYMGPAAAGPAAASEALVLGHLAEASFDVGSWNVPVDTFARIHAGERVMTAEENRSYSANSAGGGAGLSVNFNGPVYGMRDFNSAVAQAVQASMRAFSPSLMGMVKK